MIITKCIDTLEKYNYPAGSILPIQVLNKLFEYKKLDWAADILDRYRINNLNDKVNPVIMDVAKYGNKEIFKKLIALGADIHAEVFNCVHGSRI